MVAGMSLPDACQKAYELNREQEASGTRTRFVVVANPVGTCGGDYQVVSRRVRAEFGTAAPSRAALARRP
jgi:hypothetical protein